MPLNVSVSSNEYTLYLKFNAKAGRWYFKPADGDEVEVRDMTAIFDFANIRTGWVAFAEKSAPSWVYDDGVSAKKPDDAHKPAFAVNVYSPQNVGGLREFSSTSKGTINAVKDLYDNHFENSPEAKQGLVPVVKCLNVVPIKGQFGTNYMPSLAIQKWVPRPQALDAKVATGIVPVEPAYQGQRSAQQPVPAPQPGLMRELESVGDEEF